MAVLKKISGVSLRDRYINEEMGAALEIKLDIVKIIRRRRLSYFGHVSRIMPERLPISVMHGHLHGSSPRKTWLGAMKEDCLIREVTSTQAYHIAKHRKDWRKLVFRPL